MLADDNIVSFNLIEYRREVLRCEAVIDTSYVPEAHDPAGIVREICEYRGVTKGELLSKARTRRLSRCRGEIAYWLRTRTDLSYTRIGKKIGRDHTSAIHNCWVYAEMHGLPIEKAGINTRSKAVTLADVDARAA